ncbi:MAG: DNA-3-methyladenine glycosylase [Firmicutes bacterium]|nr:DNA-3-methyladenine glycosylase [Bacillota bacterium]
MKVLWEPKKFYMGDTLDVSRALIGKKLVRNIDGKQLVMEITETEAYCGIEDKASHAYNGRRTERTRTMYEEGGTIYIYLIYGMYFCLNIVTKEMDNLCAVLIRGGRPVSGLEEMSILRYNKPYSELTPYQKKNFANGPGKLCKAMGITKELNGKRLFSKELYISSDAPEKDILIETSPRVNIDYAGEYKDKLWRFFRK